MVMHTVRQCSSNFRLYSKTRRREHAEGQSLQHYQCDLTVKIHRGSVEYRHDGVHTLVTLHQKYLLYLLYYESNNNKMQISQQINELPDQLKCCVDLLQDGNLIGCLHTIITIGQQFKDLTYDKNLLINQKKQFEQQYDQMHSTLSKQGFDLKTELALAKRAVFDQNLAIQQIQQQLASKNREIDSLNSTLHSLRDSLGSDVNSQKVQLEKYKELLIKSQAQMSVQQSVIAELKRENAAQKHENQLSSTVLRASVLECSASISDKQNQAGNGDKKQLDLSVQQDHNYGQISVINILRINREIQASQDLVQQQISTENQIHMDSITQTDHCAQESTGTQNESNQSSQNHFISPENLSQNQQIHLIYLLQEELFSAKNLLLQKYETQNLSKLTLLMQFDKAEIVKILLTEIENLKQMLKNQNLYQFFTPNVNKNSTQLNQIESENVILKAKVTAFEHCQDFNCTNKVIVYYKSICQVYDEIFQKGVGIQIAHLNAKNESQHIVNLPEKPLKIRNYVNENASKMENYNIILSFLLNLETLPSNGEMLHEKIIQKDAQIQKLEIKIFGMENIIQKLKEFSNSLKNIIEVDLIKIKRHQEAHFPLIKQNQLQNLVNNQNVLIKDMKNALEIYQIEKVEVECQIDNLESFLVIKENIKLKKMYDDVNTKNQIMEDKLKQVLNGVKEERGKQKGQYQFMNITLQGLFESFIDNNIKLADKIGKLENLSNKLRPLEKQFLNINASYGSQNIKLRQYRHTLKELMEIEKKSVSVITDELSYINAEIQVSFIQNDKFTETEPQKEKQHQQVQVESICEYCSAAREIYAQISQDNEKFKIQLQERKQIIKEQQSQLDEIAQSNDGYKKKLLISKALVRKIQKDCIKHQQESKQFRKRTLVLSDDNKQLTQSYQELQNKNQGTQAQIQAINTDSYNNKQELKAITTAYDELLKHQQQNLKKLGENEKKVAIMKEDLLKQKVNARESLEMSKKSGEQLEKSMIEIKKWKSKYLNLKEKVPKMEIDPDKRNALSSLLTDDDIKSIYDYF
ncbi:hypothetical protein SS50377_22418 [Spironucleus salmonicida]|uniref:Uncharacterized protein n=1 Tax=Spironucleus salmonicida TaxID=348837 RepID=V6LC57_9EUKA|nr:hypothetical protein SS50377_22418 [Spironucleus salmonicida]|eukprot:EST42090.1 hypothetical protein SS50377_18398 [Spironucleus salmonicida]